jgi:hypothetical protein
MQKFMWRKGAVGDVSSFRSADSADAKIHVAEGSCGRRQLFPVGRFGRFGRFVKMKADWQIFTNWNKTVTSSISPFLLITFHGYLLLF